MALDDHAAIGSRHRAAVATLRPVPRELQAPRLPRHLEQLHLDELGDGDELAGVEITGDVAGWSADRVEIIESRLSRLRATGSELRGRRLRDVALEGCDLSGAKLEDARLERCSFVDCRLSGIVLASARLRHVSFRDCRMAMVNLRVATSELLRFDACDLRNSDLYGAQLPGTRFLACDLTGADVSSASLDGSELHQSRLDGLVGVLALRNVVVDPVQAAAVGHALLAAHGISVTDEPTSRPD